MEVRYQGRWHLHMMADHCWSLMRENREIYGRKSRKPTFLQISEFSVFFM